MDPWAAYLARQVIGGNPAQAGGPQGGGAHAQGAQGAHAQRSTGRTVRDGTSEFICNGHDALAWHFLAKRQFWWQRRSVFTDPRGSQFGGGPAFAAWGGVLPSGGIPQGMHFPLGHGFDPSSLSQFGFGTGLTQQFSGTGQSNLGAMQNGAMQNIGCAGSSSSGCMQNFGCAGLRPPPGFCATSAPAGDFSRAQGDAAARTVGSPSGFQPGDPSGLNQCGGAEAATRALFEQTANAAGHQKVDLAFAALGMLNAATGASSPSAQPSQIELIKAMVNALSGEKRSLPAWDGNPSSLRTWLKLLSHWELETTLPKARWGLKLYQSFTDKTPPRRLADSIPVEKMLIDPFCLG